MLSENLKDGWIFKAVPFFFVFTEQEGHIFIVHIRSYSLVSSRWVQDQRHT